MAIVTDRFLALLSFGNDVIQVRRPVLKAPSSGKVIVEGQQARTIRWLPRLKRRAPHESSATTLNVLEESRGWAPSDILRSFLGLTHLGPDVVATPHVGFPNPPGVSINSYSIILLATHPCYEFLVLVLKIACVAALRPILQAVHVTGGDCPRT
jgi:hypothetical protein